MNNLTQYGMKKAAPTLISRAAHWLFGARSQELESYRAYVLGAEPDEKELDSQRRRAFSNMPRISIICPLCNPKKKNILEIVTSLQAQTYENWELLLPDASRARDREYNKYLVESFDKVRHIPQRSNYGFARSAEEAVKASSGEYVLLMDQDGLLSPFALFSFVEAIHETQSEFIYGDEDMLGSERKDPLFKPDWSPDTLTSTFYTGRPALYSLDLYQRAGGLLESSEGAHEYDLALRASRLTRSVVHVPKILYHCREDALSLPKPGADSALRRVNSLAGQADEGLYPGSHRMRYPVRGHPLVSVIVRYDGDVSALERCMKALIERTTYVNRDIVVFAREPSAESEAYFAKLEKEGIKVERFGSPYKATNAANACAKKSNGDYLLFLDAEVEAITPDWIESMLEHAQRPEAGAVGAKLVAADGKISHAGIVIGLYGTDGKICEGLDDSTDVCALYNLYANTLRNVSAVSGSCLLVNRQKFMDAGMLDESFINTGSYVELCLRLTRKGLWNVYTPFAKLRQSGAATAEASRGDTVRSYDAYRHILKCGDPFYNINLSYTSAIPCVAEHSGESAALNPVPQKA